MKFKINKKGFLEIERAGRFKVVECKDCIDYVEYYDEDMMATFHYRPCGDWCSLFDEPEVYKDSDTGEDKVCLGLCHSNYITCDINDFADERGG